jgi:hypothetical protein
VEADLRLMAYTPAQQREHRRELVSVLRSRAYAQSSGRLHRLTPSVGRPVGYCCLGVASDLLVRAGLLREDCGCNKELGIFYEADAPSLDAARDTASAYMNNLTAEYYGFTTRDGTFRNHHVHGRSSLAYLNDAGLSFAEIAQVIEDEPDGLFTP